MAKVKTQVSALAIDTIHNLVHEVTKIKPDQALVKKMMLEVGLDYEPDLIRQMGAVLALVSNASPDLKRPDGKKLKDADL